MEVYERNRVQAFDIKTAIEEEDIDRLIYYIKDEDYNPDIVFQIDDEQYNPLLYALHEQKPEVVIQLLKLRANPTKKINTKKDDFTTVTTALHTAIPNSSISDELITFMLVQRGLDLTIVDGDDFLVHELAKLHERDDILKKLNLLNGTSSRFEALIKLIHSNEPFECDVWVSLGFPFSFDTEQISYLYHQVIFYSRLDIFRALIQNGAKCVAGFDFTNMTTKAADGTVVYIMSTSGAGRCTSGSTLLHGLIIGGRATPQLIRECLNEFVPNVDEVDAFGQTALHLACGLGQAQNVECLVREFGARSTLVSSFNKSAIQIAFDLKYQDIFSFMTVEYKSKMKMQDPENNMNSGESNNNKTGSVDGGTKGTDNENTGKVGASSNKLKK